MYIYRDITLTARLTQRLELVKAMSGNTCMKRSLNMISKKGTDTFSDTQALKNT